jgi:hypothetical protein
MKCWNCKEESNEVIKGPHDLVVCYKCIRNVNENIAVNTIGACLFCGRKFGAKYGLFRRKIREAGMVCGPQAICNDCIRLMKDILKQKKEWVD